MSETVNRIAEPASGPNGWCGMSETIGDLERRMSAAAKALDFEEARRLRDRINLLRGGADPGDAVQADTSGLTRQKSGAMGIGTSQARPVRPEGWSPPRKPDPMTTGHSKSRR